MSKVSKPAPIAIAKAARAATARKASAPKSVAAKKAAPPAKPDGKITSVKHDTSNTHVVVIAGDKTVTYRRDRETDELRKLAVIGGLFKAVEQAVKALPIQPAKLAKGLDNHNAPQSVRAAAESNRKQPAAKPASAPKAAKPAAPRKGQADTRVITYVAPNPKKGASRERYAKYRVGMTVDEALAAGLLRGDIAWDSDPKRGFIKLSD